MKTRAVKQAELDSLRQAFADNPVVVLCSFQGIKVDEDFQLRKKIRGAGAKYRVINNRLAKIAADGTPLATALEGVKGMTSVVLADDDPVTLMKALVEQSKVTKVFGFRSGVVEGQALDGPGLEALSKMSESRRRNRRSSSCSTPVHRTWLASSRSGARLGPRPAGRRRRKEVQGIVTQGFRSRAAAPHRGVVVRKTHIARS